MGIQRSVKVTPEPGAKGVTLAQLRRFVQETATLDPDAIPSGRVSMGQGRLTELTITAEEVRPDAD